MRRHVLDVAVGVQPVDEVRRHARRGARGSHRRGPTTSVERAGEAGSGPGFTHGQVATRPVASERQQLRAHLGRCMPRYSGTDIYLW